MFPLTRVPFGVPVSDPQPNGAGDLAADADDGADRALHPAQGREEVHQTPGLELRMGPWLLAP